MKHACLSEETLSRADAKGHLIGKNSLSKIGAVAVTQVGAVERVVLSNYQKTATTSAAADSILRQAR